jgi:tyrosyl-tRNA synthetase
MWRYYELLTDFSVADIKQMRDRAGSGETNPRDFKVSLAKRVISDFHSPAEAAAAEEEFVRRFRNKEVPDEVEERTLPSNHPKGWELPFLLVTVGLADSKGEARRLIQQGGVYIDGDRQDIANSMTIWKPGMTALLKVGKRRFMRVHFT